jgi:hypothetical protein
MNESRTEDDKEIDIDDLEDEEEDFDDYEEEGYE